MQEIEFFRRSIVSGRFNILLEWIPWFGPKNNQILRIVPSINPIIIKVQLKELEKTRIGMNTELQLPGVSLKL